MKRVIILLALILTFISASSALAQDDTDQDGLPDTRDACPTVAGPPENDGCPVFQIIPINPQPNDPDGDGLVDNDDQCPTVAGPRENNGCPVDDPNPDDPNDPPPPPPPPPTIPDGDGDGIPDPDDECPNIPGTTADLGCPPFEPPQLPTDACYLTPAGDYVVNVRETTDMTAPIKGHLLPGVIYEADGFINNGEVGSGIWFRLDTYETSDGTKGFVSQAVVLSSNCAEIPSIDSADDFQAPTNNPTLCHFTVGYDSPTWSADLEVPSYEYAAFWFESEAGVPLQAGTPIWGVIYIADFITLPDAVNVFAVAPDVALFEEAQNSDYAGAYNWPTLEGGIQSGDTTLYRLTGDVDKEGACGAVVGVIDDFTGVPASDDVNPVQEVELVIPINEFACTITTAFNWVFAFNYAPGQNIPQGASPLAILNGSPDFANDANTWFTDIIIYDDDPIQYMIYPGWGSLYRTGGTCGEINLDPTREPILTNSSDTNNAILDTGLGDIPEMECSTDRETETCSCPLGSRACLAQLVAMCNTTGGMLESTDNGMVCTWDDIDDEDTQYIFTLVAQDRNDCEEDDIWWAQIPIPDGRPDYRGVEEGDCVETLDLILATPVPTNTGWIVSGGTFPPDDTDCNFNGIPDAVEYPAPNCLDNLSNGAVDGETEKEEPGWWGTVLDLTCPGDWIMIVEIDDDGDEVVTDVGCWDDID